jgi:FAD/FMN-containing dehydrogenase
MFSKNNNLNQMEQSSTVEDTVANMFAQNGYSIPHIRAAIKGRVITPDDVGYDGARTVFYSNINRCPALIVRPANAFDVAYTVCLARETGSTLAVRSGGHSLAGHGASDGGIVIDLRDMKALEIDAEGRTAWAETGLTAGEYTTKAGEFGLATGFGDTGSVGIGGITLGGGVGYLTRKYGLTIDNLLEAEIVTANGDILRIGPDNYPDLFWAIRGGGGNFGVATRFKYRLLDVNSIVGGMLIFPATPDVIASLVNEAEAAPEELSLIMNVMPAPPMPFIPPENYGKLIVMAMIVYTGDINTGERAVAPFRKITQPIVDTVGPKHYPDMYPPESEGDHPRMMVKSMFLNGMSRDDAEIIVDSLSVSKTSMRATQIRVLGGAMNRVPANATAFAHRGSRMMVNLVAFVTQPEEEASHEAWLMKFEANLYQGISGAYVNFLSEVDESVVREAYPGETWKRLREIKACYDQNNLFSLNQNIPPL